MPKSKLISEIGIKAYSLQQLKNEGLMEDSLYISKTLPTKSEFFDALKKAGFKDGSDISARTSHPVKSVNLPRKLCTSFDEIYEFYKSSLKDDLTIIVHNFFHAEWGGIISYIKGEIIVELTEGDWNIDFVINTDTAIYANNLATWYIYKEERTVAYMDGDVEKNKKIAPLKEKTVSKLNKLIVSKLDNIKSILSKDYNSLEILIDEKFKLFPLQLTNVETVESNIKNSDIKETVFELKTPHDLRKWDKKTQLLISIPTSVDRADGLMSVIHEIKKYTDNVYISYGVLSHPAILLREAGISVERKMSSYKVMKFGY